MTRAALVAVPFAAVLTAAAFASDDRVTPPLVLSGEVGNGIWAYGQITKGFLYYDDGDEAEVYPLVDNDNSPSRLGVWYKQRVADDFLLSANVEVAWEPYSTADVNRLDKDDVDFDVLQIRKAEAIAEIDGFGAIWIGQGSMASDATAEADLSGTTIAASSVVEHSAGGQRFVFDGGGVSGVAVKSAFKNFDGLARKFRLRYDTPKFAGFGLRASAGWDALSGDDENDLEWDVAAVYRGELGGVDVAGAAGFSRPGGERDRLSGSLSALHKASGISLTFAGGQDEREGADDPRYGYVKLGWQGSVVDLGQTALSVDYYAGEDISGVGAESTSVGLAAVQSIPAWQTDLYATARWYDLDAAPGYESGVAVLVGARFSF